MPAGFVVRGVLDWRPLKRGDYSNVSRGKRRAAARRLAAVAPETSIFADGFESGDLSQWSKVRPKRSLRNNLSVNSGAAMVGAFGLEVVLDGSTNAAFVQDSSPENETVYRASFRINPNTLQLPVGAQVEVFAALQGKKKPQIILFPERRSKKKFNLYALVRDATVKLALAGKTVIKRKPTRITIEWAQATGAGTHDGVFRLARNGKNKINVAMNNPHFEIDTARLGLSQSAVDPSPFGTYYLDDFSSFRSLAPGG